MKIFTDLLRSMLRISYSEHPRCSECIYFTRIRVKSIVIDAGKCYTTHYTRPYCRLWKKEYSEDRLACKRFRRK